MAETPRGVKASDFLLGGYALEEDVGTTRLTPLGGGIGHSGAWQASFLGSPDQDASLEGWLMTFT